MAARLQVLAQPNQIVVGAATRAMLGDQFDLADLGAYELKGFAEPVPAWRVLSARDVESRFAAMRTGSAAPLVGRQEEMGLLFRAWDGSRRGHGQVVLIQGEAGVGKSRLVESLRETAGKDRIWVAIRCSPFHTALHKNSRFLVKGQSFRSGKNSSRELPAPIHNRTPVILPATAWRLWFGEGEFTEQWDPGSPWRDKRLRLAANLALDRQQINEAGCLGFCPPAGVIIPRVMEFALEVQPMPYDPAKA